jgi:hypothetical protein
MSPLKTFAESLLAYVNDGILGRILAFELNEEEVAVVDQAFDGVPQIAPTNVMEDRNVLVGLYELFKAWEAYKPSLQLVRPGMRMSTGLRVQEAIHRLSQAVLPPIRKMIESVHELNDEKVSHSQIALIHKMFDDRGEPDPSKVRDALRLGREAEKPNYTTRFVLDLTGGYDDALRQFPGMIERRRHDLQQVTNARPPAPESFATLGQQKVSLKQIALIKRCSLEEAEAEVAKAGYVVEGMRASLAITSQEAQRADPVDEMDRLRTSLRRSMQAGFNPESGDKANVGRLAKKGYSAAEIEQAFQDQVGRSPSIDEIAKWANDARQGKEAATA